MTGIRPRQNWLPTRAVAPDRAEGDCPRNPALIKFPINQKSTVNDAAVDVFLLPGSSLVIASPVVRELFTTLKFIFYYDLNL
jgi:hypothetical protein